MTDRNRWLTRLSMTALGSLLIGLGLPAGRARADEPATAAEARMMAAQASDRAAQYREIGGAAYKTGLVQRAELDAAIYTARAEELESPPPALSPEAEHYAKLAATYRFVGGAAYKTGLVQRAEADQRRAEEAATGTTPAAEAAPTQPNPICMAEKPAIEPSCLKGAAGD